MTTAELLAIAYMGLILLCLAYVLHLVGML